MAPTWRRWLLAAQAKWPDVPEFQELNHLTFKEELHAVEAVLGGQGIGMCSSVSVPVRKPQRQEFFRTHPDAEMTLEAAILEFRQDRQSFIVAPDLAPYLPGEAVPKLLIPALSNHGAVFLWAIRLPDEQGRLDEWNSVALEAAERAKTKWVRLMANMGAGTYDVLEAASSFPEPAWPEVILQKLLEMAFKDRFIESLDHPVLKRLRGEQ